MSSDKNLISSESCVCKLLKSITDIFVDKNWLWDIQDEFWKTNPDFLAIILTLRLDLSSKSGVSLWLTAGTMDPDDGNLLTSGS